MIFLISILIFILLNFILFLIVSLFLKDKIKILNRLMKYKTDIKNNEIDELSIPFNERILKPLFDNFYNIITKITPKGIKKRMEDKLLKAGRPFNLDSSKWLAIDIVFGFIIPVLIIVISIIKAINIKYIFLILIFSLLIILIPELLLSSRIEKRKKEIVKSLPDVLDLLTVSVEAGLSFDGALSRLAEKMDGELVDEFKRVLNEMRMGKSRKNALKDMSNRCDTPDLTTLIGSLIQADELGVPVSKVIRVQSVQMREKRRQRAQEKAMKAPVKMLFPLIFFIFPSIFVVLLGPAILSIIKTFAK